ncbi:hypothetical protein F4779DRAFT_305728 [Xylariaceae sp. FL0662B]|nr:hypothetical protein F4779DRAFT_305728 [Xylariaceae sp. FL0662B]
MVFQGRPVGGRDQGQCKTDYPPFSNVSRPIIGNGSIDVQVSVTNRRNEWMYGISRPNIRLGGQERIPYDAEPRERNQPPPGNAGVRLFPMPVSPCVLCMLLELRRRFLLETLAAPVDWEIGLGIEVLLGLAAIAACRIAFRGERISLEERRGYRLCLIHRSRCRGVCRYRSVYLVRKWRYSQTKGGIYRRLLCAEQVASRWTLISINRNHKCKWMCTLVLIQRCPGGTHTTAPTS